MSQTYKARSRTRDAPAAQEFQTAVPGPSIRELAAGARPTHEQMGQPVDLPGEIREKMEASFGADFSHVRLYESDTVARAGAEAVTRGSSIAFAPGRLDLTSTAGQALLGHELSHVVSQSRGESAGHGFLADAGLEAQADRQGMMAAQGESVYTGPVSPIGASSAVSASGPMQAKKKKDVAKDALSQEKSMDKYSPFGDDGVEAACELFDLTRDGNAPARANEFSELSSSGNSLRDMASDSTYGKYMAYKLASLNGDKRAQQELLQTFMGPESNQAGINQYIQNDLVRMTTRLGEHRDLVSEDFNTRADAYAKSKADNDLMEQLHDVMLHPYVTVDKDTMLEFTRARRAFTGDRGAAEDSLNNMAGNATRKTSMERKAYRRNRRKDLNIPD